MVENGSKTHFISYRNYAISHLVQLRLMQEIAGLKRDLAKAKQTEIEGLIEQARNKPEFMIPGNLQMISRRNFGSTSEIQEKESLVKVNVYYYYMFFTWV